MVVILAIFAIFCAIRAIHAPRLILSAAWLAGVSAATAVMLFMLGAQEIAIIELSVGAGLVTVLFVYAISMAGDAPGDEEGIIPKGLALGLSLVLTLLLLVMVQVHADIEAPEPTSETTFTAVLWGQRSADVLLHIALIYSGVLGVLGLLEVRRASESETEAPPEPVAQPEAAPQPIDAPIPVGVMREETTA